MYATFVASFEDEDATLGKAFVCASTGTEGDRNRINAELYRLKPKPGPVGGGGVFVPPFGQNGGKKPSELERMLEMNPKDTVSSHTNTVTLGPGPPTKKRREIDQFLDELKERCGSVRNDRQRRS